jgi:hypothetical protein
MPLIPGKDCASLSLETDTSLHMERQHFTRTSERRVKDYNYQNAQFFEGYRQVQEESLASPLSVDNSYLLEVLCISIIGNRHTFLDGEIVCHKDIGIWKNE